ncbi:MAG TPA: type I restriction-modification enzyme R subunit C-terminal domain-containing protein [Roseiarcus sp.]|nr:type I restriction-modification enzyme R subunit C-terminal domain-containing protein [Roseiarcus sp.]
MFARYDQKLQAFLDFVLSQYVKEGVGELDQAKLPHLLELKYRAVSDAAAQLGGVAQIHNAFIGFQRHLY